MAPTSTSDPAPHGPSEHGISHLRAGLAALYDLAEQEIAIGASRFVLLKVRDTNLLVDTIDPEEFAADERLPYWADLWSSAIELARFCLEGADLSGTRVLELGSGLGLAGIAAARAGAHVTLTDYEEDALAFARYNAWTNLAPEIAATRLSFRLLDWRDAEDVGTFDHVLAADVVYERRSFQPLLDTLGRVLSPRGIAVFSEPSRSVGEEFFAFAASQGFTIRKAVHKVERNGKAHTVTRCELSLSSFLRSEAQRDGR